MNEMQELLHRIRVDLYLSSLPGTEGKYIGRTNDEASLTIEQVCAALKLRGGFTGNYDDLVEHIKQFLDEAVYQIADGFSVNLGYFSIHPKVGGLFDSTNSVYKAGDHPISFTFRTLRPLREIARRIVVEVQGLANVQGYIDQITDVSTEAVNEVLTPGGMFVVEGHKLKIAGIEDKVGVYFVSTDDEKQRVKVAGNFAVNLPSKLIGTIPPLEVGEYKLEVVTMYSGGGKFLKEQRIVTSTAILSVQPPNESDPA
jgi:hypothetical protein